MNQPSSLLSLLLLFRLALTTMIIMFSICTGSSKATTTTTTAAFRVGLRTRSSGSSGSSSSISTTSTARRRRSIQSLSLSSSTTTSFPVSRCGYLFQGSSAILTNSLHCKKNVLASATSTISTKTTPIHYGAFSTARALSTTSSSSSSSTASSGKTTTTTTITTSQHVNGKLAKSYLNDPSLLDYHSALPLPLPLSSSTNNNDNDIDIIDDTTWFSVTDPAFPNHVLAKVPCIVTSNNNEKEQDTSTTTTTTPSLLQNVIQKSHDILPLWRDGTTAAYRASLLTKWSMLLKENLQDLAIIMTLESGKPIIESKGEVLYAASFLDYYASEATRPTNAGGGFITPTSFFTTIPTTTTDSNDNNMNFIPNQRPKGQVMAIHQAVGVTAMITPWNFPMAMITRKVGPALAAGCAAIVKPSELTPLSAIALKNLAIKAGIPNHVFQIVTARSGDATTYVGKELCTNPLIQKISFTGSTNVGKLLMKQSSDTVKRLSLELGGNAPFVVFEDADIDQAINAAMASKFRNAGQTCVCADRFLIQSSIHDEFVTKLTEKIQSTFCLGPGLDESNNNSTATATTTMGPLITAKAVETVAKKVEDAIQQGAICVIGGSKQRLLLQTDNDNGNANSKNDNDNEDLSGSFQFYEPTILTNVSRESDIWKTETFGPVVPIISFETEEEALEIANDSSVGLASYFCTRDLSRAFRFSQKLECGIVAVNDGIVSSAATPFGGVKESGLGREGSAMGLAEYLETKYIFMNTD